MAIYCFCHRFFLSNNWMHNVGWGCAEILPNIFLFWSSSSLVLSQTNIALVSYISQLYNLFIVCYLFLRATWLFISGDMTRISGDMTQVPGDSTSDVMTFGRFDQLSFHRLSWSGFQKEWKDMKHVKICRHAYHGNLPNQILWLCTCKYSH